jgi:flagellar protein FliL
MAKTSVIGIVIGTLAAVGGGFAFGAFALKSLAPQPQQHQQQDQHQQRDKHKQAKPEAPAKGPPKPAEVKTLPTIVVNLREPANAVVRLDAVVVIEPDTPEAAAIAAKIGDDLVAYVKTVSASELEGPTGFQYFREDLRKRAVQVGGAKVKELYLQSFVVQ